MSVQKEKEPFFNIADQICELLRNVLEPYLSSLIEEKDYEFEHENVTLLMKKVEFLQRSNLTKYGPNSLLNVLYLEIYNIKKILESEKHVKELDDIKNELDKYKVEL